LNPGGEMKDSLLAGDFVSPKWLRHFGWRLVGMRVTLAGDIQSPKWLVTLAGGVTTIVVAGIISRIKVKVKKSTSTYFDVIRF
jgi:hypothetical protein